MLKHGNFKTFPENVKHSDDVVFFCICHNPKTDNANTIVCVTYNMSFPALETAADPNTIVLMFRCGVAV